jgi:membrane-bound ClpP family serine protease
MAKKKIFTGTMSTEPLQKEKASERPFTKTNFVMMGCCVALIIIGFLLMSGGGSSDPNVFNPDVFSTRRIVVGPTLAFLGFLFMAFAIIWTPRRHKTANTENTTLTADAAQIKDADK